MDGKVAFQTLSSIMKKDYGYAWTWHCNIAMTAFDEGLSHSAANKVAERFMSNTFGVNTSKGGASVR